MKRLLILLPCVTLMACEPKYDEIIPISSIAALCRNYINGGGEWYARSVEELKRRDINLDKCFTLGSN